MLNFKNKNLNDDSGNKNENSNENDFDSLISASSSDDEDFTSLDDTDYNLDSTDYGDFATLNIDDKEDNSNSSNDYINFEDEAFQESEESFLNSIQNAHENENVNEGFQTINDDGDLNSNSKSGKKGFSSLFKKGGKLNNKKQKRNNKKDQKDDEILDISFGNGGKNGKFTNIGDAGTGADDFVILGDNDDKSALSITLKVFKWIVGFALLSALIIVAYFSVSYKVIPENVKGAKYTLSDNMTMISRNYKPNLDELKVGDTVLCSETSDWVPFLLSYKKLEVTGRNAYIIFVKDVNQTSNNTKEKTVQKIQSVDIDYILK